MKYPERFWPKVDKDGPGGCWLWTASIKPQGYGEMRVDGVNCYAHRISYEHHKGPIPEGYQIDHLCRVRHCVNPDHLEAVTQAENIRRAPNYNRAKTHCQYGHPYSGDNLYVLGNGWRYCRECQRRYRRESVARKAVA